MRKRVQIALAVLFVGGLGLVAWPILREREPVYQGKRLSHWLANDDGSLEAERNAQRAVEKAGTNSIPTLLTMLRQSDSPLKRRVMDLAQRQRFVKVHFTLAESRNAGAWVGFSTLGASAAFAVPSLTEIFDLKISWWSQLYTVKSLGAIGPAAKVATPVLLRGTTNSHFLVRADSLYALSCVRAEPQLAVPVLTKALRDPNRTVRFVACVALAKLGEEAKQAVPHLLNALEDPDREVRHLAIYALRSLDPEAAAKAGVK